MPVEAEYLLSLRRKAQFLRVRRSVLPQKLVAVLFCGITEGRKLIRQSKFSSGGGRRRRGSTNRRYSR